MVWWLWWPCSLTFCCVCLNPWNAVSLFAIYLGLVPLMIASDFVAKVEWYAHASLCSYQYFWIETMNTVWAYLPGISARRKSLIQTNVVVIKATISIESLRNLFVCVAKNIVYRIKISQNAYFLILKTKTLVQTTVVDGALMVWVCSSDAFKITRYFDPTNFFFPRSMSR